tara:strand:- start:4653 stop:6527 length:1875 start_codon:yes stop_codon:yes gene_type:complete
VRHRPEIDGLRAVAIIPVLAFHEGIAAVSGGFVGVDVFFVISGFLITSIIVEELDGGQFSLIDFYRRRVARILPLLLTVLFSVLIASYFLLFPTEFVDYCRSMIAAALFSSNFYFWQTTNYFQDASTFRPLLHTWTLAVEEQFYVIFPILMMLIYRFGHRRYGQWIFAAVLASFAASVIGVYVRPDATFYLLPTRAWELGIGSLIAVGWYPSISNVRVREALSATGLLLIAGSMVLLTEESAFPGWNALYPVIGSALIIAFAEGTLTGKALSWRPVVYVGLISYALYLWHWPVITLYRIENGLVLDTTGILLVTCVSFILAAASMPLLEQPFRVGLRHVSKTKVVFGGAVALIFAATAGLLLAQVGQVGRFFPPEALRVAQVAQYNKTPVFEQQYRPGRCFLPSEFKDTPFDKATCLALSDTQPNYLIIGDSHAAQVTQALQNANPQWNLMEATASGCRPVVNTKGAQRCTDIVHYVFEEFLRDKHLDGIILAARWRATDIDELKTTITLLSKKADDIIVLGPIPEYSDALPILLARGIYHDDVNMAHRALDASRFDLDQSMATSLGGSEVTYISITSLFCPGRVCIERIEGEPVSFDYGHMTLVGARFAAEGITREIMKNKEK